MASISKKMQTKDGKSYYKIRVRRGRELPTASMNWYVPSDTWSQKKIDKELQKAAVEFENQVKSGEIVSRAEQKEREKAAELERARHPDFKTYVNETYFPRRGNEISESTKRAYRGKLNDWIFPVLQDIKMDEIKPVDVDRVFANMQQAGHSQSSLDLARAILTSVFKAAVFDETISANPMDRVQRAKVGKSAAKDDSVKALSVDELKHLFACVENESLQTRCIIHLLASTGIRRGELCALRWDRINWSDGTIVIDLNEVYLAAQGSVMTSPKSGRVRAVIVPEYVLNMLRAHRQEQAASCISAYVFTKDGSPDPLPQNAIGYLFERLNRVYGLNVHAHMLRHTFASLAITNGADVVSVSKLLGHSSPSITLGIYSHASEESKRRASEIFETALQEKTGQG